MAWIYKPKPKRRTDTRRHERSKIYQDSRWQRLRLSHLRAHPLCEICERAGRVTPGEDVHHIVSFTSAADEYERDRLAFDPDNLMTLCKRCHQEMHHGHSH